MKGVFCLDKLKIIPKDVEFMKIVQVVGIMSIFLWLDLGSKRWMNTNLELGQAVSVIPKWISWELLHNTGVSFGLFSGYTPILIVVQFVLTMAIVFTFINLQPKSILMQFGFVLLISGATGNLIDRVQLGYVIDFISFRWWPAIFNIADMEIRIGTLLLMFLYMTRKIKWKANEVKEPRL
jgi:signal peptidase II